MNTEEAVGIGQEALIWLAGQPELLSRFLEASGLAPGELRGSAADPAFLGFVLEFVLGADANVVAFATDAGLRPGDPARARSVLAGGDPPAWT